MDESDAQQRRVSRLPATVSVVRADSTNLMRELHAEYRSLLVRVASVAGK